MRVAFVTVGDTSRLTGGYLYHARVFAGLREVGIDVETFVASGASPVEQAALAPHFGFRLNPRDFDMLLVDALAWIVCAPWLDRWRALRPVVAMIHELPSVAASTGRNRRLEEPLLRADRLIAVSAHGRSVLRSRGVPTGRISVVSPGCDHLSALDAGAEAAVSDDVATRVLCVAQWISRKGILDLVRAWAAHERPGATLELVGETNAGTVYGASVHAAIANVGGASIAVSGPVDDATLGAAYAAADLFALPSRYEGYGIVYAEALAYGLPIIGCDVGPVPELVGREAALLVTPGDVGALSEALNLLLDNSAQRSRMSAAARQQALRLPRWQDTVTAFRRVLEEVLTLSHRPS
ncbi:MAG: glycosyltransferase family 4 protein [Rubrobacter sp.]|nr:glycosyltransferase family 4 protein [Rubrobacter sp.]